MFGKLREKSMNAIIRAEEMNAQLHKDEPYDGVVFMINEERYIPINFYKNEYGVIETNLIKYDKRHLANLYIKIKAMQYGRKEHLPIPKEFLE